MTVLTLPRPVKSRVPLAWRNLLADKKRLARSSAGIAFAVLLMLVQLGFERAFFEASLATVSGLDGDLFVINASKYRFGTRNPFARTELTAIAKVPGVASVAPLYGAWQNFFWTSPVDDKPHLIQVFAFDPEAAPVFSLPGVAEHQAALKGEDTVLIDSRARAFLGMTDTLSESKLDGETVKVVGTFELGPDFMSDGTLMMSDRTFARFFRQPLGSLPVETAVIRLNNDVDPPTAQKQLTAALPTTLKVMTKAEIVEFEREFQAKLSSAAPIFWLGALVGFVVGTLISYQIIYTELSDRLPQYATLKGIGYGNWYLVRSVMRQALLIGIAGYIPAWLVCLLVYRVIGNLALLPLHMTLRLTIMSLVLTLGMCLVAGMIAIRRVIAADPAEIF